MFSKINKKILIAPLDWGLGHATRCIPLIRYLAEKGCHITIAAEGIQAAMFQQEFPGISVLPLRGYRIQYSGKKESFKLKIAAQVPKILQIIKYEQNWLRRSIKENHFDAVISDNRYGLFSSDIPSVFITHQLAIRSGINKWADQFILKQNYKYINRFSTCWIPDQENDNNLAGELSHPNRIPLHAKYIGWLSRMKTMVSTEEYDLACILSGPEPQRTLFEKKLLKQLVSFKGKAILIQGSSGETATPHKSNTQLTIRNYLPSDELAKVISSAKLVVCRSGYSSLMDLVKLRKKTVLIPTPGQTEQEYLAAYSMKQNIFLSFSQEIFNLDTAIEQAAQFPFLFPGYSEKYKEAIDDLLAAI